MPSLDEVKGYIKVDGNEDNELIKMLIGVADEYLKDAVKVDYDKKSYRAKLLKMAVVEDLYDHRGVNKNLKISGTTKKLVADFMLQLKLGGGKNG